MPIYEFKCEKCECIFEYLQLSDGDPPAKCPSCCGDRITKLMSASAFKPTAGPAGQGAFRQPACKPAAGG